MKAKTLLKVLAGLGIQFTIRLRRSWEGRSGGIATNAESFLSSLFSYHLELASSVVVGTRMFQYLMAVIMRRLPISSTGHVRPSDRGRRGTFTHFL